MAITRPYGRPIAERPPELLPPPEAPGEPLRFSLWQLLIATTVAAVLLAIFRAAGMFGAVLAFAAALIFTLAVYPLLKGNDRPRQALMFDFVWGLVMPVVCLVFDPFVFKGFGDFEQFMMDGPILVQPPTAVQFSGKAYVAYPIFVCQLLALAIVLVMGRLSSPWNAACAGTLLVGTIVAGAIGLLLLPLSTIGLVALIGILGYTPLFTAYSYGRRVRLLWLQAAPEMPAGRARAWAMLGAIIAAFVPAALGLTLFVAIHGTERLVRYTWP